MSKKKSRAPATTTWQGRFLSDIEKIASADAGTVEIVRTGWSTLADGVTPALAIVLKLDTSSIERNPKGLRLRDAEGVILKVPESPLTSVSAEVDHLRFMGHPHVLQGTRLCIYLDPSREWDPTLGGDGVVNRVWNWLEDAAAGRFDPGQAMYHPVGGVIGWSNNTPTIVVRNPLPDQASHLGRLIRRTESRLDFAEPTENGSAFVPVVRLDAMLPLGTTENLGLLLKLMDNPTAGGESILPTGGRLNSKRFLISLAASTCRNKPGSHQYFVLRVPNPDQGPSHLIGGRIGPQMADRLRTVGGELLTLAHLTPDKEMADCPIEWCAMSDERESVTTRRDAKQPVNAFIGRSVQVWGVGGLGSWIAEFLARAGVSRITVCDPGLVTGGLLVRQNYAERDIGQGKADALASRLRSISDELEVRVSDVPDLKNLGESTDEIVIDATVSVAVSRALAVLGTRVTVAQVSTDARTGTLGFLAVSASGCAKSVVKIDAEVGEAVSDDGVLERFLPFWSETMKGDELVPTRGCSAPTFHGSAANMAALSASFVSFLGQHVSSGNSGSHLFSLPYSEHGLSHHYFPVEGEDGG